MEKLLLYVKLKPPRIKTCGNERKIRLTLNNSQFYTHFLPLEVFTKKHAKIGTIQAPFFSLFSTKKFPQLVNSRKKPYPSNSGNK
jgi:hypothetical protein